MTITIRSLVPLDRAIVRQLRQSVGWAVRDEDPLLTLLDEAGVLSTFVAVADEAEHVAGIVQATRYGSAASIGNMIVHPDFQRRGIAQLLMETMLAQLESQGVTTTFLEATSAGRPVYERVHFQPYHVTTVWSGSLAALLSAAIAKDTATDSLESMAVEKVSSAILPEVIACDAATFGSPRRIVLDCCWRSAPTGCFCLRTTTGICRGYVMSRPGTIGPLVAQTAGDACRLLETLARHSQGGPSWLSQPLAMAVPEHNMDLREWLHSRSWTQRPNSCLHMRRGSTPMPVWHKYQALAGLGVG